MLADIQRTVYPEVTRQLHVMAQARESSPVIDRRSNQVLVVVLVVFGICFSVTLTVVCCLSLSADRHVHHVSPDNVVQSLPGN